MPLCVGGTEKGKRRKGSPPLLLGSADAFAILSGKHDQTLGERRFGSWPTKKAVLCLVSVCVCVCAPGLVELYMWVDVKLSIRDCQHAGVRYLKLQMLTRCSPFSLPVWWALLTPKTTRYPKLQNDCPLPASLSVKTLYLAMNEYCSSENVTNAQEHGGPAVLLIRSYTRIRAQSGTAQARFSFLVTHRNSIRRSGACKFCSGSTREPSILSAPVGIIITVWLKRMQNPCALKLMTSYPLTRL